jgi:hypothetical protein
MLSLEDRKRLFAAFNPQRAASVADHVDVNETRGRGFMAIEESLALWAPDAGQESPQFLVSGLLGSGKTSEIGRVKRALEAQGYLVALADAEAVLDLSQRIDVPDVLLTALFEADRRVLVAEDKDPTSALQKGVFGRFLDWLKNTDANLEGLELGVEAPLAIGPQVAAKASFSLHARPGLHAELHKFAGRHLAAFLREIAKSFTELNQRALAVSKSGLVVIVDSLEKLRGTTATWDDVLGSAERLFGHGASYLRLPVPTVYTVPPALARRVPGVDMLPMIKVHNRKRQPHADGVAAIVSLVQKRASEQDLHGLFGAPATARLHEIAKWSGGYPREVIRVMNTLITQAGHGSLGEHAVMHTLAREGSAYRELIDGAGAREWAARVASRQAVETLNVSEEQIADRLMTNNVLLKYVNNDDWWDLHPAVWGMPGIEEAVNATRHR